MTMRRGRLARALEWVRLIAAVRHRVELRRRRRHPQLLAAVVLGAAFGTVLIVGTVPLRGLEAIWPEPGAYHYGTVVDSDGAAVLARTRELAAIVLVATAALGALGATTSDDWEQPPVEVVTAIPLPAAIVGILGDELLESGWFVGPVVAGGALAFTVGTGDPRTAMGAAVGGVAVLLTGLLSGTATGVAFRAAIRRSPRLYAARYALSVTLIFVVFMGLAVSRTAGTALAATPLGWYGDLLLWSTPGIEANRTSAGFALLLTAMAIPLTIWTVIVGGRSLWFAETVLDDGTVDDEPGSLGRILGAVLVRVAGRPSSHATRTVWRRMRRSPRAMVYVVLPLAFVGPVTLEVASTSPTIVPPLLVLYVAGAVGLGTTLNPLGNERVALALIRTTPGGVDTALRGHLLAALVPGLPIAGGIALFLALVAGMPPPVAVAFVVSALAITAGGCGLSLAVGAYLPNLEGPTDASLSPPELYGMFGFLLALSLPTAPLIVGFATGAVASPAGAITTALATVAIAGVLGRRGYRYARYRLETADVT